uniref:HDAg domain-containing protein n=2 Tax=Trichuris muris TaxID=70415 RepID=A0A5S6QCW3_TRIMR
MQESNEFEEIESRLLTDFSFSKSRIVSWLSSETLSSINLRFVRLRNTAKMNFLLAIMHLPKENLRQWRDSLLEILAIASRDADDWIQTIATLLSSYVDTQKLCFPLDVQDDQLDRIIKEVMAAVLSKDKGKHWDVPEYYMTQSVRRSMYHASGNESQATEKKHFNLRKRPKANMDRLECLQRAELARSQSQLGHPPEGIITCEVYNMATPACASPTEKGIKTNAPMLETKGSKIATRKEVAVKMIDLSETPQALKTKRKSTEQEEKAAKRAAKEEQKKQKEKEREVKRQQIIERKQSESSTADYAANIVSDLSLQTPPVPPIHPEPLSSSTAPKESGRSVAVPVLILPRSNEVTEPIVSEAEQKMATSSSPSTASKIVSHSLTVNGKSTILRLSSPECKKPVLLPSSISQAELAGTINNSTMKMVRSGDIFDKSNCLTSANRALINDFIDGKRDASLLDKGVILLLKMDERRGSEIKYDGSRHPVILQTFCRLDYRNGSIGKVLKARPIGSNSSSSM